MPDLMTIRPKLRQNAIFLLTDDGILFQRDDEPFVIRGKAAIRWFSSLKPYLDGKHTLEELCAGFEPARREMVVKLVNTLIQKGILKAEETEAPTLLPEHVTDVFHSQIEFIDHYATTPLQRFKTFREGRILLLGSGAALVELACGLARNGLAQLALITHDDTHRPHLPRLERELELLQQQNIETTLSLQQRTQLLPLSPSETCDLLVYCSDTPSLKEIAALNQYCWTANIAFLSAWTGSGRLWIGPLVEPHNGPCWFCAQMRLATTLPATESAALWRAHILGLPLYLQEATTFPQFASRLGNALAFELFKYLSGALTPEVEQGVIYQDLETLEMSRAHLIAHPLCPVCSQNSVENAIERLQRLSINEHNEQETRLSSREILAHCAPFIDPSFGPLQAFDDEECTQFPLRQTRLLLGPAFAGSGRMDVTGYSLENVETARLHVALEAIRIYTSALPDERAMLFKSQNELIEMGAHVIVPSSFSLWTGLGPIDPRASLAWLPALSVFSQRLCYVPAGAVYSHSALNTNHLFERIPAGASTGHSFQEVWSAGLLSALGYEGLRHLLRGEVSLAQLHLDALESTDPELAFLLSSAHRLGESPVLFEIIHDAPVHVILAYAPENAQKPLACSGFGLSSLDAAKNALFDFVAALQAQEAHQSFASPFHALLPHILPAAMIDTPEMTRRRSASAPGSMNDLEAYVLALKYAVLFVETTTLDFLSTDSFISGVVLLAHDPNMAHS